MQRIALTACAGLLAAVGGYAACPTETECTLEARPSVIVQTVENVDGRLVPVKVDEVRYLVNPHPSVDEPRAAPRPEDAECADEKCVEWIAGREQTGEFTVTASVCGEEFTDVALVEMGEDECHVDTQTLVLEVDRHKCAEDESVDDIEAAVAPECTLELRPSFVVHTVRQVDDMVIPTRPESIAFRSGEGFEKVKPMKCADDDCTVHYGPWEQAGTFFVDASFCGATVETKVVVPMDADGCHVTTQSLYVTFDDFKDACLAGQPQVPPIPPPPVPAGPDGFTTPPSPPPPSGPDGIQPVPVPPSMDIDGSCVDEGIRNPAFLARTMKVVGDMVVPIRAESLTFTTKRGRGESFDAACLDDTCSAWRGPNHGPGVYTLTAHVCGVDTKARVMVAPAEGRCGVITAYPYIEVDTKGCLAAEPEVVGEPWRPPTITTPPTEPELPVRPAP